MSPLSFLPDPVFDFLQRNLDTESCTGACIRNWKILFSAILVAEGLIFSHVIFALKKWSRFDKNSTFIQKSKHFGNSLSAGIFLSAGLLHLLPEVIELFEGGGHHDDETGEEGEEEGEEGEGGEESRNEDDDHDEEEEEIVFPWAYFTVLVSYCFVLGVERVLIPRLIGTTSCDLEEDNVHAHLESAEGKKVDDESDELAGFRSPEFVKGVTRVLALSFHSLVESMAVGLSGSFSTTLNIFIALVSHRWATAMSIAFNLAWSLQYLPFLILVLIFTLTVPLGVGVGSALTGLNATAQGVFFGISTATFIYLGGFAAVSEEFVEHRKWLFSKFMYLMLGAAIISVITGILVVNDIHG